MTAADRTRARELRHWQHTLNNLHIGASVIADGIAVARLSENRYIVLRDGDVYDDHTSRMTVGLAIARALEAITGEAVAAPCADCGAPRTTRSYCDACAIRRVQESKHRSRAS